MSPTAPAAAPPATWDAEVRALEERGRVAFLAGDVDTLHALWSDDLLVNSPLNVVSDKPRVLELLQSGRIRHTRNEVEIERVYRIGDVVVVMGRDRVDGPPHGELMDRRFTNVWQFHDGAWTMIARHAHTVGAAAV